MNFDLEFHDSRVSSVNWSNGVVTIIFDSASLFRPDGVPGSKAGTAWIQAGSLKFEGARLTGTPDIGEGWMVGGAIKVGEADELHVIPVPFNVSGNIAATFTFNNSCVLRVDACAADLNLMGEARFLQAFPGL